MGHPGKRARWVLWAIVTTVVVVSTIVALRPPRTSTFELLDPRVLPPDEQARWLDGDLAAIGRAAPAERASLLAPAVDDDAPWRTSATYVVCQPYDAGGPADVVVEQDVRGATIVLLSWASPMHWTVTAAPGAEVVRVVVPMDRAAAAEGQVTVEVGAGVPAPTFMSHLAADGMTPTCALDTAAAERFLHRIEAQLGAWPVASITRRADATSILIGPGSPDVVVASRTRQRLRTWRAATASSRAALRARLEAIRVEAIVPYGQTAVAAALLSPAGRVGEIASLADPFLYVLAGGTTTGALVAGVHAAPAHTTATLPPSSTVSAIRVVDGAVVISPYGIDLPAVTADGRPVVASHVAIDQRRRRLLALADSTVTAYAIPDGLKSMAATARVIGSTQPIAPDAFEPRALAFDEVRDEILLLGRNSLRVHSGETGRLLAESPLAHMVVLPPGTKGRDASFDQMWHVDDLLLVLRTPRVEGVGRDTGDEAAVPTSLPEDEPTLPRLFVLDGRGGRVLSSTTILPPRLALPFWPLTVGLLGLSGLGLFTSVSIAAIRRGRLARRRTRELAERTVELESLAASLAESNEALAARTRDVELYSRAVSHELRGPLAAAAEALGRVEPDEAVRRWTEIARDNVRRATAKATRLAQLMASSAVIEDATDVELADVLPAIVDELRARPGGTSVDFVIAHDLPLVLGQAQKIGFVFQNLLENAFKHVTGAPGARIEIGSYASGDDRTCWVRDNGPGIDATALESVFEPFHHGGDRRTAGMGLGLAIVRQIVDENHGEIWVESSSGSGSTFFVTLPTRRGPQHDRT